VRTVSGQNGRKKMNERIRLLAKQTTELEDDELFVREVFNKEKFVQLIIHECNELNRKELSFTAYARMAEIYSQHFGVDV
jgi:hypothetical protein